MSNSIFNLSPTSMIKDDSIEIQKIQVLIGESQNIRTEMTMVLKTLHNSIFAFIAVLGVCVGILADKGIAMDNLNNGSLAFFVSQIEIVIVVYCISLSSDVTTKAAYLAHIETKINSLLKDDLVFWESKISLFKWEGTFSTMKFSIAILYFFYFAAFVFLSFFCFDKTASQLCLWIQIVEVIVVVILLLNFSREHSRIRKYITGWSAIKKV